MRERDNMGPVNLRAEVESQEITDQMGAITDEIAEAVLFLAGPRASVITGQVLYANCGGHMA